MFDPELKIPKASEPPRHTATQPSEEGERQRRGRGAVFKRLQEGEA
jgi:hypothetical protein